MLNNLKVIVVLVMVYWCTDTLGYTLYSDKGWANKQADIYFLVDSSSSVWVVDYRKQLKFIADLVEDMDIRPSATRVGVGIYSHNHTLYIPLDNGRSKQSLKGAINEAPYQQGNGYLSFALQGMRKEGLAAGVTRTGVPLISVLFTDGRSRHPQLTADNATLAKRDGIFLFTIGIGTQVDRDELRAIASDPKPDFTFYAPDFDRLENIRTTLSQKMSKVDVFQGDLGTCGENTRVDTVFVYDEAALGLIDTKKVKNFLKYVTQEFSMNSGNVRVGVISKTCQEADKGDIMLGQYVTKEDFSAELDNDYSPDISNLLQRARLDAFLIENGARRDAKKRIVLILHAPVQNKDDTTMEALRAKFVGGIEMFVIRIGTDYDKDFITNLATDTQKAFFIDSTDHLLRQKETFINSFCQDL